MDKSQNAEPKTMQPFCPAVQPTLPGEVMAVLEEASPQGARLRLLPTPGAMDTALSMVSAGRWKTSRYLIGKVLYCKLSLFDPALGLWIDRDAPDCGQYRAAIPNAQRSEEAGSLYAAMRHFGFWGDIAALPGLVFSAEQVHIQPVMQGQRVAGYRLAGRLIVSELQRGERGEIVGVTLRDTNGGAVQWQAANRSA